MATAPTPTKPPAQGQGQATTSTSTQAPRPVQSKPPFQITSLKKGNRWLKICIYGKHGVGKTSLGGSSVDVEPMQDVFMINAESGEMVLEDNDLIKNPDEIDIATVTNFKQVGKMYEYLSAHCKHRDDDNVEMLRKQEAWLKGVQPDEIETPRKYRTVIIDSLTEIEAYCLYNLLGIMGEFDLTQIDEDMKNPEFAEYKKNNNMVNLLIRAFRDLPLHVIVLVGQTFEQDEMKRFHYGPSLTGKLRSQIQGYFDIVGYLTSGNPGENGIAPRRLYVQPVGKFDAKNRRPSFKASYFDNPTMTDVMKGVGLLQPAKKAATAAK